MAVSGVSGVSQGMRSQIVDAYMKTPDGRRRLLLSMETPSLNIRGASAAQEMLSIAEAAVRRSSEEGVSLLEDEKIGAIVARLREKAGVRLA
jgi:hypothetical protein